jgi:hypothetical protein
MAKFMLVLLIVCSSGFIFYACVCRLQMTNRDVLPRVRHRYWLIGTASLIAPFGAWLPFENGGLVGIAFFFVANAVGFLLDKADWAHGVPDSATMPAGLEKT